jgi:hypothetical protein
MQDIKKLGYHVRNSLLWLYCVFTNYRFRKLLPDLQIPDYYSKLTIEEIRAKATASLTSASAFLGFTVAVLIPLVVWEDFRKVFEFTPNESKCSVLRWAIVAFALPYITFWCERYISAASVEKKDRQQKRARRSVALVLFLVASLFLFLGAPEFDGWRQVLQHAFPLAGVAMIVLSVFFLVFALEFYDSASGWRGVEGLHFHLASIASNSYMFGVSLALTGLALNLSLLNLLAGQLVGAATMIVLVVMIELERHLWDSQKLEASNKNNTPPSNAVDSKQV